MNKKRRSIPKQQYQNLVHGNSVNNNSANDFSVSENSANLPVINSANLKHDLTEKDLTEKLVSKTQSTPEPEITQTVRSVDPVEVKEELEHHSLETNQIETTEKDDQIEETKKSVFNQLGSFLLSVWGYWLFPLLILISVYVGTEVNEDLVYITLPGILAICLIIYHNYKRIK